MPLFSTNTITSNAAPTVTAADNPKVVLSPPRSPQLDSVGGMSLNLGNGMAQPLPSKLAMNPFYLNGTATKSLCDSTFPATAGQLYPSTTATAVPEWDMLALMRAKAKLAQLQSQMPVLQESGLNPFAPSQAEVLASATNHPGISKRTHDEVKSDDDASDCDEPKGKRRKKGKKPSDMPRRALSAYNIFFSEQRALILKEIDDKESGKQVDPAEHKTDEVPSVLNRTFFPTRTKRAHRKVHGKIGLVSLARTVSKRWKELSDERRKYYQDLADEDKKRHKQAMADYQERKAAESMLTINNPAGKGAGHAQIQSMLGDGLSAAMAQQYQQQLLAELMTRTPQQPIQASVNFQQMMSQRLGGFPTNQSLNFGGNGSFGLHQNMW